MYEYKFHKSLYRSQYNFCCPPMWNNHHMNFWIDYRVSKPLPICISSICVTFWSKGKKYILKTMIYFWSFLWFIMVTWVILGGFHSWPFFDLSLCFWVTGQISCKENESLYIFCPWGEKSKEFSLRKLAVVLGPYNLSKKSYGNRFTRGCTKVIHAPGLLAYEPPAQYHGCEGLKLCEWFVHFIWTALCSFL